ncbi:MAG: sugar-binding protein [Candidatus Omnitrophota bacterium]
MKNNFFKTLFLAAVVLVPGARVESAIISIASTKTGNIFNYDEEVRLTVTVKSYPREVPEAILRCCIFDYYGESIKDERIAIKYTNSQEISREISLRLKKKGIFYVSCELLSGKDVLAEKKSTFGIIPPAPPLKFNPDSPFGICSWFDWDDPLLELYEKIGIRWIRMDWPWNFAENEGKDKYVWAHFDDFIPRAERHHLNILACVVSYPKWANGTGYLNTPPKNVQDFADFLATSVKRYKDRVKNWELLNEANLIDFWNGPVESYTEMLKLSYQAAKKEDPDCVIHLGSLSMPIGKSILDTQRDENYDVWNPFLEAVLKNGGGDYFDIFGIHTGNYLEGAREGAKIGQTLKKRGYDKPLWMTEMANYPSGPDTKADTELRTKLTIVFLGEGISKVFWFLGTDILTDESSANLNNIGMLYRDLTPKSAYLSYAALISELDGARPVSRLKMGAGFTGYYFEKKGEPISVLWSNKGNQKLNLNVINDKIEVVDIMGNPTTLQPKNGVLSLDLDESPVYMHVKPEGILAQPTIKLRPYLVKSSEKPVISVSVDNCTKKALSGDVSLAVPGGWVMEPVHATLEQLNPSEETSLKFTVESGGVIPDAWYGIAATLKTARGLVYHSEETMDFLTCVKTLSAPEIDGLLKTEWDRATPVRLEQASQVREIQEWHGRNDLSAVLYTLWDERNLYLAGRVYDDKFVQDEKGDRTWAGDSIQFAVDPEPESPVSHGRVFTIALTPEGPQVWENFADQAFGAAQGKLVDKAIVSIKNDPDGWTCEAAIPLNELLLAPVPGKIIGFSALVNDNDGQGRRGWLEWAGGIGYCEGSRLYGDLIFVEP